MESGVSIRGIIARNSLRCFVGTLLLTVPGIFLLFAKESESLEGIKDVISLMVFAIGISFAIALISLTALFGSAKYIYRDGLLFAAIYFIPTITVSTVIFLLTIRFDYVLGKLMAISLIPVCTFLLLWTYFYFTVIKGVTRQAPM